MTGPESLDLRAEMRAKVIDGFGGWSGMIVSAVPTVVFIVVNAITSSLRAAVIAAVGTAIVLTMYRLMRHQPLQQAFSGLLGVLVAAIIAGRTGEARGFFLLGIWMSFAYLGVFIASILVRRPLVGAIWEFLDPTPHPVVGDSVPDDGTDRGTTPAAGNSTAGEIAADRPWHRRPVLFRAYLLATLAASAVFAARALVQLSLFDHNATGWLAVARIAMGYPLLIAVLALTWWLVRRARRREFGTAAS